MNPSRSVIPTIYAGHETYWRQRGLELDLQGWNSQTPLFDRLITKVRPATIVEIGVWKGASLIHMAEICRRLGLQTVLYGIDVWFGHKGDMITVPPESPVECRWMRSTHYDQFMFNVAVSGFSDCIIPVWQLSRWGATCLAKWGVVAELIYIDADHDEEPALADMRRYWQFLAPGGIIFGDDFSPTCCGVPAAVERFSKEINRPFHVEGVQWYFDPK